MAALGTASVVIAAFKVTNPWAVGGAAVAAAVVVAVSGVWQERYKRIATRHDETAMKLQDGCLVLADGRLPKVSQVDDPIRLGVHPAIALSDGSGQNTQAPAYVPRDADAEVRERLASGGFVLLVGDSTAGKSRTAFEAMRATLPDHLLIAPHDRAALPAAIERAVQAGRAVVWLSDLEHYLGTGGLTREHIARITGGGGHHRVILATLRSAEQARLTREPSDGDDAARLAGREVRETLEQAHPIRLARVFTAGELERARARDWDARISSALNHAGKFGIAEYLASGPELQRDYDDAWDVGVNPRGAALVAAAVDCRRAGFTSPVPRGLLEELHVGYLEARGGHRLRPESEDDAWEWATSPRRATTALLSRSPDAADAVTVFDYLVDACQQAEGPLAHVPDPVFQLAVDHVYRASDAEGLGSTAVGQGRYHLAEPAWRKAVALRRQTSGEEHPDTLTGRHRLAGVLRLLGRLEEAEAEHRAVLQLRRRVLGEDHRNTLSSRNNLAVVLGDMGRLEEAEAEHRAVLQARRRVLGEEWVDTLSSRSNLAGVLRLLGRSEEAEAEHRAVLEISRRVLGEEHPNTLGSRNNLAVVLGDLGRLEEAEAEHRAVLQVRRRVLGEEHPNTLGSRNNVALMLGRLGRLEEAEAEHRAVLEISRRVLGEEHPRTLTGRDNLANVLRELGRSDESASPEP
ncbi:tetratricopeptide repeat protein [Planotetraspora thailandica]|uniref:tetratricopeptide repeat protein n=1 Tax=Planotetraspora thailandica TaxID=487172 RepID=UPI001950671F|nr:tetratricopeptide repeat protein [Planotetraspora thailandica]